MITFESRLADRRRVRGFFRESPDPEVAAAVLAERYWDDDDRAREPILRRILQRGDVAVVAYPTLSHHDVFKVFLRGENDRFVFACVLLDEARLCDMLAQSSPIVEGFALQILPGEHPGAEDVCAALRSWVGRCFPDLASPSLAVERWAGPDSHPASGKPRAPARTISLFDQNDQPEEHVLLSGDPGRRREILTAKVTGSGLGLCSWCWRSSEDRYVPDPESRIWLDEDAVRGLAAAMPDLARQMEIYLAEACGGRR